MTVTRAIPRHTREAQARASDPAVSAWVSANAGAGKTHVLVQRVIRLLLENVPPSKILCLTFTKAAAANMAQRVFERLAAWTSLDDGSLSGELEEMTGKQPSAAELKSARRLFARAVETPGGLKIETMHAFCERLLHLFPFEANVAARFEVIEDLRQADLLSAARSATFAAAASGSRPDLREALAVISAETTAFTFDKLVDEVIAARGEIATLTRWYGIDGLSAALSQRLGLEPGEDVEAIERRIIEGGVPHARWGPMARTLGATEPGPNSTPGRLLAASLAAEGAPRRAAYVQVFFTQDLEARNERYLPRSLRRSFPDLCAALDAEQLRLTELLEKRRAALAVRRTLALLRVGDAIVDRYAHLKAERNVLDFDDLIAKTLALLNRSDAAWVLYKLDQGIDHILIDEAQDTSSDQWRVLQNLASEFTAGEGARNAGRTLFAVGDEKQSIFSFQGAAPQMFDHMRRHFEQRIRAAEASGRARFTHVPLHLSFRSVPAVLDAVDCVFSLPENFAGLSFDLEQTRTLHESLKRDLPGRIEIWDTLAAKERPDPTSWSLPLDVADDSEPALLLARRIAATIGSWLEPHSAERVHGPGDTPRPIRPGDVLILVRTRNAFFEAMIRALKDRSVPVAGADRMMVSNHIAVMDLIAAGRAALLRDDDLSLACALKSPLLGLADEDLLELAPARRWSLAGAIAADLRYAQVAARLEKWRWMARHLAPFEFYMALLSAEGGRKRFAARLGPEADDAIGEFLRLALEHERTGPPSLIRFLASVEEVDLSIKRDMEAAGDSVRVMTVHAAKGLEAKIVVLADTCGVPTGRHDPKLFRLEPAGAPAGAPPLIVWSARQDDDSPAIREARQMVRRRALEEHRRLLYVAMTRAEERLIIAGYEGKPRPNGKPARPDGCWYDMILKALGPTLMEGSAPWDPQERILWRGQASAGAEPTPQAGETPSPAAALPDWLQRPAPVESEPVAALSPSRALPHEKQGATALKPAHWTSSPDGGPDARAVGGLVHVLLEQLPEIIASARREAAARLAGAYSADLSAELQHDIVEEALRLLEMPELLPIFGPDARAEVAIAGRLHRVDGSMVSVTGRIDRLAVTPTEVVLVDFKTGSPPGSGAPPQDYVAQLALYRALVAPLYPDKKVRALLVWAREPRIVEVGAADLDAALTRTLAP